MSEAFKEAVAEVKSRRSMRDVAEQYGIHIQRNGFCRCPFHSGDNTPSMKIYQRDYHCFACGANGDIFSFVQQMEGCDFKTAFTLLGGEYRKDNSFSAKRQRQLAKKRRKEAQERAERLRERLLCCQREKNMLIDIIRENEPFMEGTEPVYPEAWCVAVDRFEYVLYEMAEINKELRKGA